MGWWVKNTVVYNLVTHSMDKIMEAFDPSRGQICKDEQGKLQIQVEVDWPATAGLSHSKEYKSLFKWAKHFNNYHPEIRVKTFRLKNYHLLRYQTKTYDKRVTSLSIFSQEKCQVWRLIVRYVSYRNFLSLKKCFLK
jgi:hypothetical protein